MMQDAILTLNAGSSSLKLGLFPARGAGMLATGLVDQIGANGRLTLKDSKRRDIPIGQHPQAALADHETALKTVLKVLTEVFPDTRVVAVGHRVVHGGTLFNRPALLDDNVIVELEKLEPLAPLHQPHNLAGIRAARAAFPAVPQVACFDTAFHRSHPWVNDTFGLPRKFYDQGIRRYGFHGLSYDYISGELARMYPSLAAGRVAVAHLGNGASMCGLRHGQSMVSSMGFSALDGLPMGTRCGQLDPGVVLYLMQHEKMNADQIADLLYRESGLKGLSGLSNDMRALELAGTVEARQAIEYFTFRIRRELGATAACLGGLDGIVFCGGIGENSAHIRALVCEDMEWLGIELDPAANDANDRDIGRPGARVRVMVIPTDEESVIARGVRQLALAQG